MRHACIFSRRRLIVLITAASILSACTKETSKVLTSPKATEADSATIKLTAETWILKKVEYPKDSNIWVVLSSSSSLDYDTLVFGADNTFTIADNGSVSNTGTWKLSTDSSLLSMTYGGVTETDTVDLLSNSLLRLIIPQQIAVGSTFYYSYRDTYSH